MTEESPDTLERRCLGGCLRWNAAIADVFAALKPADFRIDAHQRVALAVLELWDAGKPVDTVTVAERLKERGDLADVGYPLLAELWDCEPTGASAEYYATLVRQHSILRRLAHAGKEIARDAEHPAGDANHVLEEAERKIFGIAETGFAGNTVPLSVAVGEASDRIDAAHQAGRSPGIPTGFPEVDAITAGLQPGELIVVAARPSTGKTAMGLHLAQHAALREGVPTFFASLEQSRVELAERMLCYQSGVDGQKLRQGRLSPGDFAALGLAGDLLRKAPVHIDDTPGQTVLRIAANARRLKLRHKIGLVVVDYLQLIESEDRRARRHEVVDAISKRLKALARDLSIPVVALAQLNRGADERDKPKLSDLRESGGIEQNADTVWLMWRNKDTDGIGVDVAKQRNGPTAETALRFVRACQRFESVSKPPEFGS